MFAGPHGRVSPAAHAVVAGATQIDESFSLDGGVAELDGGCTVGLGACAHNGVTSCSSATLVCSATAGTQGTEACNGLDDDCDGQVDEASATLCAIAGQACAAGTCACPGGQAVCGASCQAVGASCSNGVGACNRPGVIACSGTTTACNAVAGAPATEVCDGLDNDCDGIIDNSLTLYCYPDEDNDRYATNTNITQFCPDFSPGIDCDPTNANLYRNVSTRADADNDAYCTSAQTTLCVGATAPAGRRFTASCAATDDCNDANANLFTIRTVRADVDGDGFCVGASFSQCGGATELAGTRVASGCNSVDDCRDTNPFAGVACTLIGVYRTAAATKQCGIGFPPSQSFSVATTTACPTGFSLGTLTSMVSGASGGTCAINSSTSLTMSCQALVFGSFSCAVAGDCIAN